MPRDQEVVEAVAVAAAGDGEGDEEAANQVMLNYFGSAGAYFFPV